MPNVTLKILEKTFTIHQLQPEATVPQYLLNYPLVGLPEPTKNFPLYAMHRLKISNGEKSEGWSCFKVLGPLDFALTGILAKISSTLTSISIFAISTYDTDYISVKSNLMKEAKVVLETNGYLII